jgi:hypothetical protein
VTSSIAKEFASTPQAPLTVVELTQTPIAGKAAAAMNCLRLALSEALIV